ncbi:hypothetical protein EKD04_025485 [Chloroflexales bacterium ZM16-3]|nr:hypothetical protein [Chloroflexales bacterium ZM16-3]
MVARDQAAAQAWAQQEIAQGPLFVEAIGFFSDDTSALVEVAVIDSNGDTCLNTLVRTALPLPRWAQLRYRLSLSQIRVAPRMDAIAPDLAEKIMWEHIVSWNSHTPSALIASCLHDTGNAVPVAHWDDLRPAYARYVGDWMPRAKRYRLIGLPGRGPLALQCARASLNALREMAGMPALQFAAAQRWRPIPLLEERDPDADPDLWIE